MKLIRTAGLVLAVGIATCSDQGTVAGPPEKLSTADTPLARNIQPGTLAYYAPCGNVVLFYESFREAAGLYEIGRVVSGVEHIRLLQGTVSIEK